MFEGSIFKKVKVVFLLSLFLSSCARADKLSLERKEADVHGRDITELKKHTPEFTGLIEIQDPYLRR